MPSDARSPLVLLHGFTDSRRTWDQLVPLLEPHHDVLAPATLGHAGGAPLPEPMDNPLEAILEQLERDLDAAGIERAHLVGSSLGGWLALELAARGRAHTVVALSPAGGWTEHRAADRTIRRFKLVHAIGPFAARHAEALVARPRLRKLALRDVVAHGDRIPPATAAALLRGNADCAMFRPWVQLTRSGGFPRALGAVDVPVRILWGTQDRLLPKRGYSEGLQSLIPHAEWIDLPGCGHLPHHDDPHLVARLVLEATRQIP